MFASAWPSTGTTSSLSGSMVYVWTRRSVCSRKFPKLKFIESILYALRYPSKRHRQCLVEIDNQTVHHSGGEILALLMVFRFITGCHAGYMGRWRCGHAGHVY